MTIVLQDTFTDSNGTRLNAHTMNVGTGWTELDGTWVISSNAAIVSGGTRNIASSEASVADVTIQCTVNYRGATSRRVPRLVANLTNASNYWVFQFDSNSNQYSIQEVNGNVFTSRAVVNEAAANGTMRLVTDGDTITGYTVGGSPVTYSAVGRFNKTGTKHGIGKYKNDTVTVFDDFSVEVAATPVKALFILSGTVKVFFTQQA